MEIEKININTPYKLLDLVVNKMEDLDLKKENIYRLYVADHLDLGEINKSCSGYQIWQINGLTKSGKANTQLTEEDIAYQEQNFADEMVYLKSWLETHYKDELTEEQIEKILKYVEEWKNKGE